MQLYALEHVPNLGPPSSSRKKLSLAGLKVGRRSWLGRWPEPAVKAANCCWVTRLATSGCGKCGFVFAAATGVGLGRSFLCWCFALLLKKILVSIFNYIRVTLRLRPCFYSIHCIRFWSDMDNLNPFFPRCAVHLASWWTIFFPLVVRELSLREVPGAWHTYKRYFNPQKYIVMYMVDMQMEQ